MLSALRVFVARSFGLYFSTKGFAKRSVRFDKRRFDLRLALALVAVVATVYLIGVPRTPPGFCLDESSIAFNAQLISTTGHDEYDEAWPLFFKAFGEYKNPVYIYLPAGLFKFTGPSIAVARCAHCLRQKRH